MEIALKLNRIDDDLRGGYSCLIKYEKGRNIKNSYETCKSNYHHYQKV